MPSLRAALSAALLTASLAATAHAQMPAAAEPSRTKIAAASTIDEVKSWTRKHYHAASREWMKDKVKWTGCRREAKAQKLTGRANWSFLYACMER